MTSLYRQETQVGVVKSRLKQKQLVGSLLQSLSGAYEQLLSGPSSLLGPRTDPLGGGRGRKGGNATEPHPCQPVILATHQRPDVRIGPFYR